MKIPQSILNEESEQVRSMFLYWDEYMAKNIEFWPLEGDLDVHTEGHAERVLLLALKIGERRQLMLRSMIALSHAAIFHDTRRKDNFLDVGHGDRAADYYRDFCKDHKLKFLPETFAAIKFHDRDDNLGIDFIRHEAPKHSLSPAGSNTDNDNDDTEGWLEVYRDFKDADALDRLRLGPWSLDESYLRTEESKGLVDFAEKLVEATIESEELKKVFALTKPFADKMKRNKK